MIEFTLRHECVKCEGLRFTWAWSPATAPISDDVLHTLYGELVPEEHIRLTCDRCGFAVAMKPRDAGSK